MAAESMHVLAFHRAHRRMKFILLGTQPARPEVKGR